MSVEIDYDPMFDVLYAVREGALIGACRETPSGVILSQEGAGLILVGTPTAAEWWTLPERAEIPTDLFDAVAEWAGRREREALEASC